MILALLLTAFLSVGSVFLPGLIAPASRMLHVLGTPFRAAATAFADRVEAVWDYSFRYQALKDRVETLEAQVAEMAEENRTAEDALEENVRLRELLELRQARNDLTFESATITGRSGNSWESVMTISKGTSSGIRVDMCVVTENGYLVGIVTDAGANWATVTTLIDPGTSLGALVDESAENVILNGELDAMIQGQCRLSYVSMDAELAVGDTVLTSGLGGIYPAGLPIGTVIETGVTASGMERYALVEPLAHLGELKQVFVIKAFDTVE